MNPLFLGDHLGLVLEFFFGQPGPCSKSSQVMAATPVKTASISRGYLKADNFPTT